MALHQNSVAVNIDWGVSLDFGTRTGDAHRPATYRWKATGVPFVRTADVKSFTDTHPRKRNAT
jgi:hypothetical protein